MRYLLIFIFIIILFLLALIDQLGMTSSTGLLVNQQHLDARADGPPGALASVVPGHGGDVWFVHMDSGRTAVFSRDEMRVKVSQ